MIICILAAFLVGCQVEQVPEERAEPSEPVVKEVIPAIDIVSIPQIIKENEAVAVNWRIDSDSPLTAVHTAIHYDVSSHAGAFSTEVGPQDSGYPTLTKEYASGKFPVPDQFSTSFPVPEGAEKIYLRAHTIIDGKNYWTDEISLDVAAAAAPTIPAISIISIPGTVKEGEKVDIRWKIDSEAPLTAVHTAIHYDTSSHPGPFTTEIGPEESGYPSLTIEYASGQFPIPGEFTTSLEAPAAEKIYLRAHTIVDGKNYWTPETSVGIEKTEQSFVIEGDDRGLYPDSISVKKGASVTITFQVRSQEVYFGGLDFRSDVWGTTGKIKPGQSGTVEFTADQSFEFKSYWPASNKLKATGQVIVE